MHTLALPLEKTFKLNKLVEAYLNKDKVLEPFYPEGYGIEAIVTKAGYRKFNKNNRQILHDCLIEQYAKAGIKLTDDSEVFQNIKKLLNDNCFTITAGQQIHAYGGPLFVAFKLLSATGLAKKLNDTDSEHSYVPVFWMATEDHDFEEISSVTLFGRNFTWEQETAGNPVGHLPTTGLSPLGDALLGMFKNDPETREIVLRMQQVYGQSTDFATASHTILHELFAETGIIILNPDDAELKKLFSHVLEAELQHQGQSPLDEYTSYLVENGFSKQISARDTNLFFINEGKRERLKKSDNAFELAESGKSFKTKELISISQSQPELFSPNVALRPIYQETILPGVAYIAGSSEIIYWYQIKGLFEFHQVPYPMPRLRPSGMFLPEKQLQVIENTGLEIGDLFLETTDVNLKLSGLLGKHTQAIEDEINILENAFRQLEELYRVSEIFSKETLEKIKEVKKENSDLFKAIRSLRNDFVETAPVHNKIIKIKELYFNHPQERHDPLFVFFKYFRQFPLQEIEKQLLNNRKFRLFIL